MSNSAPVIRQVIKGEDMKLNRTLRTMQGLLAALFVIQPVLTPIAGGLGVSIA